MQLPSHTLALKLKIQIINATFQWKPATQAFLTQMHMRSAAPGSSHTRRRRARRIHTNTTAWSQDSVRRTAITTTIPRTILTIPGAASTIGDTGPTQLSASSLLQPLPLSSWPRQPSDRRHHVWHTQFEKEVWKRVFWWINNQKVHQIIIICLLIWSVQIQSNIHSLRCSI